MKRKLQKIGCTIAITFVVLMIGYNFLWLPFWNKVLSPTLEGFFLGAMEMRNAPTTVFDDQFVIIRFSKEYALCFNENPQNEDSTNECILSPIITYAIYEDHSGTNDWFFAVSLDGYAILEKNSSVCRVYLKPSNDDTYDYRDMMPQHKKVICLSSFEEFEQEEQEILKSLEESPSWKYEKDDEGFYRKVEQGRK